MFTSPVMALYVIFKQCGPFPGKMSSQIKDVFKTMTEGGGPTCEDTDCLPWLYF